MLRAGLPASRATSRPRLTIGMMPPRFRSTPSSVWRMRRSRPIGGRKSSAFLAMWARKRRWREAERTISSSGARSRSPQTTRWSKKLAASIRAWGSGRLDPAPEELLPVGERLVPGVGHEPARTGRQPELLKPLGHPPAQLREIPSRLLGGVQVDDRVVLVGQQGLLTAPLGAVDDPGVGAGRVAQGLPELALGQVDHPHGRRVVDRGDDPADLDGVQVAAQEHLHHRGELIGEVGEVRGALDLLDPAEHVERAVQVVAEQIGVRDHPEHVGRRLAVEGRRAGARRSPPGGGCGARAWRSRRRTPVGGRRSRRAAGWRPGAPGCRRGGRPRAPGSSGRGP